MYVYVHMHNNLLHYMQRLGAAIVVKAEGSVPFLMKNFYNPLCFIQYYDPEIQPTEWKQVASIWR